MRYRIAGYSDEISGRKLSFQNYFQRSLCTLVCKWNYRSGIDGEDGWDESFMNSIGLKELLLDGAKKIGKVAREPGRPCLGGKQRRVIPSDLVSIVLQINAIFHLPKLRN